MSCLVQNDQVGVPSGEDFLDWDVVNSGEATLSLGTTSPQHQAAASNLYTNKWRLYIRQYNVYDVYTHVCNPMEAVYVNISIQSCLQQ